MESFLRYVRTDFFTKHWLPLLVILDVSIHMIIFGLCSADPPKSKSKNWNKNLFFDEKTGRTVRNRLNEELWKMMVNAAQGDEILVIFTCNRSFIQTSLNYNNADYFLL